MAKVIEFHIPKSFQKSFMRAAQRKPGNVIEFSAQTQESGTTRPTGGIVGRILGATQSNRAVSE